MPKNKKSVSFKDQSENTNASQASSKDIQNITKDVIFDMTALYSDVKADQIQTMIEEFVASKTAGRIASGPIRIIAPSINYSRKIKDGATPLEAFLGTVVDFVWDQALGLPPQVSFVKIIAPLADMAADELRNQQQHLWGKEKSGGIRLPMEVNPEAQGRILEAFLRIPRLIVTLETTVKNGVMQIPSYMHATVFDGTEFSSVEHVETESPNVISLDHSHSIDLNSIDALTQPDPSIPEFSIDASPTSITSVESPQSSIIRVEPGQHISGKPTTNFVATLPSNNNANEFDVSVKTDALSIFYLFRDVITNISETRGNGPKEKEIRKICKALTNKKSSKVTQNLIEKSKHLSVKEREMFRNFVFNPQDCALHVPLIQSFWGNKKKVDEHSRNTIQHLLSDTIDHLSEAEHGEWPSYNDTAQERQPSKKIQLLNNIVQRNDPKEMYLAYLELQNSDNSALNKTRYQPVQKTSSEVSTTPNVPDLSQILPAEKHDISIVILNTSKDVIEYYRQHADTINANPAISQQFEDFLSGEITQAINKNDFSKINELQKNLGVGEDFPTLRTLCEKANLNGQFCAGITIENMAEIAEFYAKSIEDKTVRNVSIAACGIGEIGGKIVAGVAQCKLAIIQQKETLAKELLAEKTTEKRKLEINNSLSRLNGQYGILSDSKTYYIVSSVLDTMKQYHAHVYDVDQKKQEEYYQYWDNLGTTANALGIALDIRNGTVSSNTIGAGIKVATAVDTVSQQMLGSSLDLRHNPFVTYAAPMLISAGVSSYNLGHGVAVTDSMLSLEIVAIRGTTMAIEYFIPPKEASEIIAKGEYLSEDSWVSAEAVHEGTKKTADQIQFVLSAKTIATTAYTGSAWLYTATGTVATAVLPTAVTSAATTAGTAIVSGVGSVGTVIVGGASAVGAGVTAAGTAAASVLPTAVTATVGAAGTAVAGAATATGAAIASAPALATAIVVVAVTATTAGVNTAYIQNDLNARNILLNAHIDLNNNNLEQAIEKLKRYETLDTSQSTTHKMDPQKVKELTLHLEIINAIQSGKTENLAEFEKKLKENIKSNPESKNSKQDLAMCLFHQNKDEEALPALQAVLDETPDDHNILLMKGSLEIKKGKFEAARDTLKNIPEASQHNENARTLVANSYAHQINQLREKEEKNIENITTAVPQSSNPEEVLKNAIAARTDFLNTEAVLTDGYNKHSKTDASKNEKTNQAPIDPFLQSLHQNLVTHYFNQNKNNEAHATLQTLMQAIPNDPFNLLMKGGLDIRGGNFESGRKTLMSVPKDSPLLKDTHTLLAASYLDESNQLRQQRNIEINRFDEEIKNSSNPSKTIEQAIQAHKDFLKKNDALESDYRKYTSEADNKELPKPTDSNPDKDPFILHCQEHQYLINPVHLKVAEADKQVDKVKLEEELKAIIKNNPDLQGAKQDLAVYYDQQGRPQEVLEALKQLPKQDDLFVLCMKGKAETSQGHFTSARSTLKEALKQAPQNENVQSLLASVDKQEKTEVDASIKLLTKQSEEKLTEAISARENCTDNQSIQDLKYYQLQKRLLPINYDICRIETTQIGIDLLYAITRYNFDTLGWDKKQTKYFNEMYTSISHVIKLLRHHFRRQIDFLTFTDSNVIEGAIDASLNFAQYSSLILQIFHSIYKNQHKRTSKLIENYFFPSLQFTLSVSSKLVSLKKNNSIAAMTEFLFLSPENLLKIPIVNQYLLQPTPTKLKQFNGYFFVGKFLENLAAQNGIYRYGMIDRARTHQFDSWTQTPIDYIQDLKNTLLSWDRHFGMNILSRIFHYSIAYNSFYMQYKLYQRIGNILVAFFNTLFSYEQDKLHYLFNQEKMRLSFLIREAVKNESYVDVCFYTGMRFENEKNYLAAEECYREVISHDKNHSVAQGKLDHLLKLNCLEKTEKDIFIEDLENQTVIANKQALHCSIIYTLGIGLLAHPQMGAILFLTSIAANFGVSDWHQINTYSSKLDFFSHTNNNVHLASKPKECNMPVLSPLGATEDGASTPDVPLDSNAPTFEPETIRWTFYGQPPGSAPYERPSTPYIDSAKLNCEPLSVSYVYDSVKLNIAGADELHQMAASHNENRHTALKRTVMCAIGMGVLAVRPTVGVTLFLGTALSYFTFSNKSKPVSELEKMGKPNGANMRL